MNEGRDGGQGGSGRGMRRMFQAESANVRENLTLFREKQLTKVEMLNSAAAGRCTSDDGTPHTCNHSHDEEE